MFGIGKKNKQHMDCKRLLYYENNCKEEMAIKVYLRDKHGGA